MDQYYPYQDEKGPVPIGKWKTQIQAIWNIICASEKGKILFAGAMFCLTFLIGSCYMFGDKLKYIVADPTKFKEWMDGFGIWDDLIFVILRSAQTIFKFIPAEPIEIASGYIWGITGGTVYCLLGNLIGTVAILSLTRKYGKKAVDYFVPVKNQKIVYYFKDSRKIYWMIFFLYLIPGMPKDGFTYMAGVLHIKVIPYLILTGIARIPSIATSAICGSLLAEQEYRVSIGILIITCILAIVGFCAYQSWFKKQSFKKECCAN